VLLAMYTSSQMLRVAKHTFRDQHFLLGRHVSSCIYRGGADAWVWPSGAAPPRHQQQAPTFYNTAWLFLPLWFQAAADRDWKERVSLSCRAAAMGTCMQQEVEAG